MNGAATGEIALAERLLALLDRGAFTSTYKYAVVLALLDLCLEGADESGAPPTVLTTRQMAEKVIELYWPQARPWSDGKVLRQSNGRPAKVLSLIEAFVGADRPRRKRSFSQARRSSPAAAESLLDHIEWVLIKMPLPKLQRVGSENRPVLYTIAWNDDVRVEPVRAYQRSLRCGGDADGRFDNRIQLLSGVGEALVRLGGVLRPLLHREWARMVARLNRLDESRLEAFLFEPARRAVAHLAGPLRDIQDGRCFYCGEKVGAKPQVDHVIPFARIPDHSLANLVLTDGQCNGNKRDHLPAVNHLRRLRARNQDDAGPLADIAERFHPEGFVPETTWNVVTALYARLPVGLDLWVGYRDRFEAFEPAVWREAAA